MQKPDRQNQKFRAMENQIETLFFYLYCLKVHECRFENHPISSSSYKQHVDDFTSKHLLFFEICAREICGKLVYKHSETIEYVKNYPTF